MKKQIIALFIAALSLGSACNKIDIAPLNIIQDKDVFTDAGMRAYMAALYSRLPIEDFKYGLSDGGAAEGFNTWNGIVTPELNTGTIANRNQGNFADPGQRQYWRSGYQLIRNANYIIENLPEHVESIGIDNVTKWVSEAKFIRAYTYFALARRYGGVPIADQILWADLETDNNDHLKLPRNSEEDTYDFILQDLDEAYADMPVISEQKGRVNKNVIAAFISRVALHAGSIARYGALQRYAVDGVMLTGIPDSRANDYFSQSFKAAKAIEGVYSLYKKKWSATDKVATADNYADLFLDAESPETIFFKAYQYPYAVHSFDAVYSPPHMTSDYGDRYNITLDYVELFDGLPKNEKGQLNTLHPNGTYVVYNTVDQLWENAEPRLRGTALLPGQEFKGFRTDIRRGTIIESVDPATPIQKMVVEEATASYNTSSFYQANIKSFGNVNNQEQVTLANGTRINPIGIDGPTNANTGTITGFHGRKWMQPNITRAQTNLHLSDQTWIDIRYAEILLNRAEAALELSQNGVATLEGVNLQQDAYLCINLIRERAGATLLTSSGELSSIAPLAKDTGVGSYVLAPTRGLQIIRVERRKELAFENKLWWDLVRWRTADQEINNRIWRKCNPFLFARGAIVESIDYVKGKYIFDCRYEERSARFTVPPTRYYQGIPNNEIAATDGIIKQNNNY
ncbi:RagB/SusD family nutrient uptake outer membrane protein [Sphingobacterium corticibacterium]|uniref:RagB/SusD family nutrient uptake outer membrane protein n=1 Tax=Sphingobacterium corticibacterium TaxID=2484746 RepID=A0A4Q6XFS2_9SPHI|nr:RagB/SusD family nutrient uptake outer membrane protein [Sphingobacterium corticibacterium]RZF58701.1 RagB/SusD family nutrient uptake outer membrane protein [Sphingobacterium corticibacterium]